MLSRFYTYITPNVHSRTNPPRTFIVLPKAESRFALRFVLNRNTLSPDEIQAHTGMFDSKTNDGYYELGLTTAKLIREAIHVHRMVEAAREERERSSRPPSRSRSRPTGLHIHIPPQASPSSILVEQDSQEPDCEVETDSGSDVSMATAPEEGVVHMDVQEAPQKYADG